MLTEYCIALTPRQELSAEMYLCITLILKYNMDFKQNVHPPPIHFYWLCEKDKNTGILPVVHFLWPHSQFTAFQSSLVFSFQLKISREPEQLRSEARNVKLFCSLCKLQHSALKINNSPCNYINYCAGNTTNRKKSRQAGVYAVKRI